MSNGFNKPSSTRVDIPMLKHTQHDHGSISKYRPNLIDRFGDMFPDTGPIGIAKGIYRGMDKGLLGILPSGRYEAQTGETKTGEDIGVLADPFAVGRGARVAVSGFNLFGKKYSTPLGRLIANNIEPLHYGSKTKELIKPLTNWKAFKESVIQDIPQYQLGGNWHKSRFPRTRTQDRLYAWRQKFNIDHPPNPIYDERIKLNNAMKMHEREHKRLTLGQGKYGHKVTDSELDRMIPLSDTSKDIYKKFGVNPKTGTHYYKKKEDYMKARWTDTDRHGVFGGYTKKHGSPQLSLTDDIHYYDDWDFALNRSPLDPKYYTDTRTGEKSILGGLNTMLQRKLGNYLTKKVEFKGSFKNRRSRKVLENAGFKRNLNKTPEYKEKRRRFFVEKQKADRKAKNTVKTYFDGKYMEKL